MTGHLQEIGRKPKNAKIEWIATYRSENFWSKATLGLDGKDAYIKMQGSVVKMRLFIISEYRNVTAVGILQDIAEIYGGDTYPLGRNFHDCIMRLVAEGMKMGYKK